MFDLLPSYTLTVHAMTEALLDDVFIPSETSPNTTQVISKFVRSQVDDLPWFLGLGIRFYTLLFDGWLLFKKGQCFHSLPLNSRISVIRKINVESNYFDFKMYLFYKKLVYFGYFSFHENTP